MKDGSTPIFYFNEILDTGKSKPIYKVTPDDDTENPIVVDSSSAAWKQILEKVNQQRHPDEKRNNPSVSGPEYFGLAHPTVLKLIEDLPGVDECTKYKRKTFEEKKIKPV